MTTFTSTRVLALLPFLGVVAHASAQASFTAVGDLAGSLVSSQASAISGDGRVVVGMSLSSNGQEAFRWQGGSITGLGDLPGFNFESYARGVSFDGSVIVGSGSSSADGNVGFKWTQAGGMSSLKDLSFGSTLARAYGVSGDGLVAVGYGTSAAGRESVRWTSSTATNMGDFAGGPTHAEARGASSDGAVIAGTGSRGSQFGSDAFRWTSAGGFEYIGDLPGGNVYSEANGISGNGNVIAGTSIGTNSFGNALSMAYRWTAGGGMIALESLVPNGTSHGYALSPDGQIVGGDASDGISLDQAVIWDSAGRIIDVKQALIGAGLGSQVAGWSLTTVTGVANSQNGFAVVCGNGVNALGQTMGWTAHVPLNSVPEPATMAVMGCGLVALMRRRRQRV